MPNKERDLLADLRICEEATPGPWEQLNGTDVFTKLGAVNREGVKADDNDGWYIAMCNVGPTSVNGEDAELSFHEQKANARFISEAREGWPYAIRKALEAKARVEELEVEVEQIKKDRDGWHEAFKKACVLEHRAVKERNALKEELDELRKIVSSECPVGALDIANSLRVEKWHMQERIAELEAEVERLKAQIEETKDEVSAWKKIALGFDKFWEG